MIKKIIGVTVAALLFLTVATPIVAHFTEREGENPLLVYVLDGQSNAANWLGTNALEVVREEVPLPTMDCFYYGTDERPIWQTSTLYSDCSIHPMVKNGTWAISGEEPKLAQMISSKSQCPVLIINPAIGGMAIDTFATGYMRTYTMSVINYAISDASTMGYDCIPMSWIWIQGESDATTEVSKYVADFGLVRDYMNNLGFSSCYMVQTETTITGETNVTAAQNLCCKTYSQVYMGSTAPSSFSVENGMLTAGDEIHWTQKGRDIVAGDLGKVIINSVPTYSTTTYVSSVGSIISIIPALIAAGLILGVVGMFITRRD